MPRTRAPSMPTSTQIAEAHKHVSGIHPDARIRRVGPDGIEFVYPDEVGGAQASVKPFNARPEKSQ